MQRLGSDFRSRPNRRPADENQPTVTRPEIHINNICTKCVVRQIELSNSYSHWGKQAVRLFHDGQVHTDSINARGVIGVVRSIPPRF